MRALGIEDGLDGLRYNKVVILATDADVDGMHIRNLLLTYFLHYFEQLVLSGSPLHPGDAAVPGAHTRTRRCTATARRSGTRP